MALNRSLIGRNRDLALLIPGLVAVAGGVGLAALDGGFPPTVWYPAALFGLVLLVVSVMAAPPARASSRLLQAGFVGYAVFVALAYASIAWADAPGEAWNAANRALMYGLALALVALRPWPVRAGRLAVGIVGFGIAGVAAVLLVIGVTSSDPSSLFLGGRLAEPAGYLNATANLWLIGLWPALYLATSRASVLPVRGLALAAATVLMEMELLSQSRGAVIAFGVTAIFYLLVTSNRWPTLLALLVCAGFTALSFDTLVDVRDAARAVDLGPALDDAARAIALSAAGALVIGLAAVLVGRRLRPVGERPGVVRAGNVALLGLAGGCLVAVLVAIGNPGDWAEARWDDFKTSGYSEVESGRTRFTGGLGSNRYDFYRVALKQFEEQPVAGVGGDNFADPYLLHRRTPEAPRHPHSLALRVLSQHGILGSVAFLVFLVSVGGAALRARRCLGRDGVAVGAAALAAFVAFFVHALGDWLWAFPALGVLAFTMLGVAARLEPDLPDRGVPVGSRIGPAARVGLALFALAAAASLALPGIAARYTAAAYDEFSTDPRSALDRLDRAADLNPLSDEPLVAEGVIEQRLGRPGRAIEPLRQAIERRPGNWFSHLELGLALAQVGRQRAAEASLEEARRLNPRQPLVAETLTRLRAGRRVDPAVVEERLYQGLRMRLRATDPDAASGR